MPLVTVIGPGSVKWAGAGGPWVAPEVKTDRLTGPVITVAWAGTIVPSRPIAAMARAPYGACLATLEVIAGNLT